MTSPQPNVCPVRNAGFGFGVFPWSKGPLYELQEPWFFEVMLPDGSRWADVIPSGYQFNLASVPPCLWGMPFGYTPDGLHRRGALEHDYLCDLGMRGDEFLDMMRKLQKVVPEPLPHKIVHQHFHRMLLVSGMRKSQADAFGYAVKLLGPRWKTPGQAVK